MSITEFKMLHEKKDEEEMANCSIWEQVYW